MRVRIPARLRKGDCVGIVAPASPPPSFGRIRRGIQYLEKKGFRIKPGRTARKNAVSCGYLAENDETRAGDINEMFADPDVKAIICTRGGYGSLRILPHLKYRSIAENPKIFVGYSDVTALQVAFFSRCRMVTFAGPMLAVEMRNLMDPYTEEELWRILCTRRAKRCLRAPAGMKQTTLHPGTAEGHLLGGNLAILASLCGSSYLPAWDDTILIIEDVAESVYRIDRMLAQLRNAGILDAVRGIIAGYFTGIRREKPSLALYEVLHDYFAPLHKPILIGYPFGHALPKATVPIGARVRLDASAGTLTVLQPVVI